MSRRSIVNLIDECNNVKYFKQMHAQLITSGILEDNQVVVNKVIGFFAKSTDLEYACEFLNQKHCQTSSFPFNSLIAGYSGCKTPEAAILVYRRIVRDGFKPDKYTFPVILKSCAKFSGIGEGRQFHGIVMKAGLLCDLYVQNALVHLYSVCGTCDGASKLFDGMPLRDVVSWTGLISGYVRAGLFAQAIVLYSKMDVEPNSATLVSVLVACGRSGDLGMGKGIHGLICKHEFKMGLVMGNALMDMYVKFSCLGEAKQVFYELPDKDMVSWTCIISGLVQCKYPKEALELFRAMQVSGVEPDKVTIASILSACASLGAFDYGRWVHEYVDRKGIEWDVHLGTAMVDMYAKCGCIEMAMYTFCGLRHKNIFTWNALIGGLAMHGNGKEALNSFQEMLRLGTRPTEVTFLAVLSACCHSGLVDEGRQQFYQMSQVYNLAPRIEHYGCMIDLLCRAGLHDEAWELIGSMPMPPDVLIWGALLSAYKTHGDVEMSQKILTHLLELESTDSGVYVLLSNVFASNDKWEDAVRIRRLMKEKGITKSPGSSVIEVDGKPHEFLVGGTNHPQKEVIHLVLNLLAKQVYLEGHTLTHF